ncbi:MAG: acyl-CoA reductase [Verrucomicrobiota bacterium]
MLTADRAQALANAAASFADFLGPLTADDLTALVTRELGHPDILDDFQPHGSIKAKAVPPEITLHIISGNTPHAGLQSLLRALLIGSPKNCCKIPATGLPEIAAFKNKLPLELANTITIESELPDDWLAKANAIIVYGTDETIARFHRQTRPNQIFISHGHKISLGIIFDSTAPDVAKLAARDASRFDQQGCLSPQFFYVAETNNNTAQAFAESLATEMNRFNSDNPPPPRTPAEEADIAHLRSAYSFRAASDPTAAIWSSENSLDWTVLYETDPNPATTPLPRTVFVKPLPDDLPHALALIQPHLSTVGLAPFTPEFQNKLTPLKSPRLCPIGQMQNPSPFWHPDGQPSLSPLIRWIDQG